MHHRRIVAALSPVLLLGSLSMSPLTGCGSDDGRERSAHAATRDLPSNVTIVAAPGPLPPHMPDALGPLAGRLAELVDFHDRDFSGSWYSHEDGHLYIGAATEAGRALLEKRGLTTTPEVRVVAADRSLAAGQEMLSDFAEHSILGDRLVSYATLPEGDGFHLGITGSELSDAELAELGNLPVRVVVTTGEGAGFLD